jgi:hypothetical protein
LALFPRAQEGSPAATSSSASRRSCAGIFSEPVLDLIGEPGPSFPSESLPAGILESLSFGARADKEPHPRRHRHPDIWRFPRVQSPLPGSGDGWMFLREGHVPAPFSPGPEKAGGDLPAKVFTMLLAKGRITKDVIAMLSNLGHSGFQVYCREQIFPRDESARPGKPGPVHYPGFFLIGTDVSFR